MLLMGIDIGGSGIKGALVDTKNGALATDRMRIKTPQPSTPKAVIEVMARLIEKFDYDGPVGAGFPAVVMNGTVLSAANVSDKWIGYKGAKRMSKALKRPVTLVNDADAAGIAEMRFGAGRKQSGTVIVLTLGTGIGSAIFVDGRLVPNTEMGHLYLKGQKRDAEDYASDRIRVAENLDWKAWASRLDKYMAHLEFLFSPDLFILGGGISKRHNKFIPYLKLRATVVPAQLRNEAGIVGAAMATAAH